MRYNPKRRKRNLVWLAIPGVLLFAWLIYQIPPVHDRLFWRVELAQTYLRGIIYPAGAVPTPLPHSTTVAAMPTAGNDLTSATPTPKITATAAANFTQTPTMPAASATPKPSPTPIPETVRLEAPTYVLQTINNCGPASLAMYLDYYGWEGTQDDISALIKPVPEDRNVNVEELVYYVRTRAGWLNAEYRVGGTINLLKQLIAAGIPVMIEESFHFQEAFWPNDDLWAAHYLLLTGYDDTRQVFTTQDSFYGPNQAVEYSTVDKEWQIFNRVYIVVYPPSQQAEVENIIGPDWDMDTNRQRALETSQLETKTDAGNAYAWFNLGSNLVYFERYAEAAQAYDQARTLGLPQRMLRYQFGPFFAYFHTDRIDDLLALTEYALQRTPNSEEALLWHGWALYRKGDTNQAVDAFRKALEANPYSQDAIYALDFLGVSP